MLTDLSGERTWLRLLYYDESLRQSDVISKDYFLAPNGQNDPLEELKATIDAYRAPFPLDPNQHARCRFPARYAWLDQHLHLEGYQSIPPQCENLRNSINETRIDSLSLMFVSGYLGNPASSFGHSFIKLNDHTHATNNLFDLSISYGADVPPNENIFAYMYKGLTGEYEAAFKDKYFFSQDLVYSSTEFRDIWEYELDLPQEKITFFQLHLWEILGKKFRYLFLNKNCGYEVSKMLEIIQDDDLAKSAKLWFAPVETLHAMIESNEGDSIIKQKRFHPSEQKKVYQRFHELSIDEQHAALTLINHSMEDTQGLFDALENTQKTNILNFVITYYNYLLVKDKNNPHYETLKKKALLKRFALPPQRESELQFPDALPPDYNDKPSLFSVNFNYLQNDRHFASINFSPYSILSLGKNNLEGDELKVLDTEIGISKNKLFLKELNLINIKQFDRYSIPMEESSLYSWQLETTVRNTDWEKGVYDTYIKSGIGKSGTLSDSFLFYAMLDASIHSSHGQVIFGPEIGVRADFGHIKMLLSNENGFDAVNQSFYSAINFAAHFKLRNNEALIFKYKNSSNEAWSFETGMQFNF